MYRALIHYDREDRVRLDEEELHHLVRVRRAREGERFLGFTEEGKWFLCELFRDRGAWGARTLRTIDENRESPLQLVLAQALIKKAKFEWVIQKASELGVAQIVPLLTTRTEVRLQERALAKMRQRWRRILVESVKQSGRTSIPQLHTPLDLGAALSNFSSSLNLVLDEGGGKSLKTALSDRQRIDSCTLFVGPEGGWDQEDRKRFSQYPTVAVYLGPRVLRAETAALVALAILQYELGDIAARE